MRVRGLQKKKGKSSQCYRIGTMRNGCLLAIISLLFIIILLKHHLLNKCSVTSTTLTKITEKL